METPPRWWRFVLALSLCLGTALASAAAETPAMAEHQLRALYLYNFTRYIEWPPLTNQPAPAADTPFVIGVAGAPEVEEDLGLIAREKRVAGRPLVIRHLIRPEDGSGCDLVYLGFPDSRRATELLKPLLGSRTVTVGECEDFLGLGGLVRLVRRDRNVRPQIQLGAATRAGFTVHARLLSAAEVVR